MSLTCTNTGNCHSVHVPVITYLPLVKATESVLPTLLLIRDTIACHGESICIVIITDVNSVAFTSSWSASEHAKHGPASFTILILTLAANTATRIPAYIAAHFFWCTNIAGTYNPFNWHLQLSNCRTLGRASWFIHNNWSTPCLTTRPVLLRAWHIGFKDQNSATCPPPLPPLQR